MTTETKSQGTTTGSGDDTKEGERNSLDLPVGGTGKLRSVALWVRVDPTAFRCKNTNLSTAKAEMLFRDGDIGIQKSRPFDLWWNVPLRT